MKRALWSHADQRFNAGDAFVFCYGQNLICVDVKEYVDDSAGPDNFEAIRSRGGPHPKMYAKVVLAEVTGARLDLANDNVVVEG